MFIVLMIVIFSLLGFSESESASKIYGATSLTGGGTGALDSIGTSRLSNADVGIVVSTDFKAYFYTLDSDSGATESVSAPYLVIKPDDETGNKRWILTDGQFDDLQVELDKLSNITAMTEAQGDVLYYDGSDWNRLAKGTDGQILESTATNPQWANATSVYKGWQYIITKVGSTYYALNGITGVVDYSGSVAHTVINNALSNLTAGRDYKETVVLLGDIATTDDINVSSYTVLDLRGAKITLGAGASNHLISNSDVTNGNTDIDIIGGVLDGNGENQTGFANVINISATGGVDVASADGGNTGTSTATTSSTTGIEEYGDYVIEITADGTPDVFKWSDDGGRTYTTGVNVSTSNITLSHGVKVLWDSTTTSVIGDIWTFKTNVSARIKIIGTKIYDSEDEGIHFSYASEFLVDGVSCEGAGDDCVSIIEYTNTGTVTNLNCRAGINNTAPASSCVEIEDGAYNVSVTSSHFFGEGTSLGKGISINVDSGSSSGAPHHVTISGNTFRSIPGGAIVVVTNKTGEDINGVVIADNVITDNGDLAILVTGKSDYTAVVKNFTLIGNTITNTDPTDTAGHGISVNYSNGVTLNDNAVEGSGGDGIKVVYSKNLLIENNILVDNYQASAGYAIHISNSSSENIGVLNNMLIDTGGTQHGIYIGNDVTNLLIQGNLLDGAGGSMWGISLAHNPANVRIIDNDLSQMSTKLNIGGTPTNLYVHGNGGYVTEKGGATASVADGGTISHGLFTTPTYVLCTPTVINEVCSISAKGTTTFTVQLQKTTDQSSGTSQTIYWRAVYIP